MPRRDGTGPIGEGPMTGRAMGPCAGYRRGRRNRYYATGIPGWAVEELDYDEKEVLQKQLDNLKNQLADIEKRMEQVDEN